MTLRKTDIARRLMSMPLNPVQTDNAVRVNAALLVLGLNEDDNPVMYWEASDILHAILEGKRVVITKT